MRHRAIAIVSAVAVLVALVSSGAAPAVAQTASVRTAWGEPDLRGIWDFRTITPLQRPEALADQAFNEFSAFPEDALVRIAPDVIRKKGRVPKNGSVFFTIFQTFMAGSDEDGNPNHQRRRHLPTAHQQAEHP